MNALWFGVHIPFEVARLSVPLTSDETLHHHPPFSLDKKPLHALMSRFPDADSELETPPVARGRAGPGKKSGGPWCSKDTKLSAILTAVIIGVDLPLSSVVISQSLKISLPSPPPKVWQPLSPWKLLWWPRAMTWIAQPGPQWTCTMRPQC